MAKQKRLLRQQQMQHCLATRLKLCWQAYNLSALAVKCQGWAAQTSGNILNISQLYTFTYVCICIALLWHNGWHIDVTRPFYHRLTDWQFVRVCGAVVRQWGPQAKHSVVSRWQWSCHPFDSWPLPYIDCSVISCVAFVPTRLYYLTFGFQAKCVCCRQPRAGVCARRRQACLFYVCLLLVQFLLQLVLIYDTTGNKSKT